MKWQPIETAPKDGTEIFFFRDDFGVGICCWLWAGEACPKDQYGDPLGEYNEEFYGWADRAYGWVEESGKITHWMPLPEPPSQDHDDDEADGEFEQREAHRQRLDADMAGEPPPEAE